MGAQKESRRVPNRGPKAIRAENCKTLIFNDLCKDSNDLSGARGLFGGPKVGPKWGPNRIFDAEASEYLLGASWIALGALRSRKKVIGIGSWAAKRRLKTRFQPARGVKPLAAATPPSQTLPQCWLKPQLHSTSSGGALSVIPPVCPRPPPRPSPNVG